MNKKVLIISSSPRKGGNSDLLCDQFLTGVDEAGHQVEKIFLGECKIYPCIGCYACSRLGECFKKDNANKILEKMVDSDVIVLGAPVYFYSVCSQLKMLIGRTFPKYQGIRYKEFYFILTAADTSMENMQRTLKCLRGFTFCLDGAVEKGIIYGLGVHEKGKIKNKPAIMKQAYNMGTNV